MTNEVPFIETPDLAIQGLSTERNEDRRAITDALDLKSEILRLGQSI